MGEDNSQCEMKKPQSTEGELMPSCFTHLKFDESKLAYSGIVIYSLWNEIVNVTMNGV
ncbi:hypothetical protein TanjilG_24342 [Lupinus angustifolius]|uniref:Uncharacterized protein n=1 Tax=Lupinus angustifolius TaxID=3871 RepID=A0A1J7I290_LUPAN|nr:hypothetical protein TanjilG_24342 [Lupinus angustifolius]